jgi:hypothetical protein
MSAHESEERGRGESVGLYAVYMHERGGWGLGRVEEDFEGKKKGKKKILLKTEIGIWIYRASQTPKRYKKGVRKMRGEGSEREVEQKRGPNSVPETPALSALD